MEVVDAFNKFLVDECRVFIFTDGVVKEIYDFNDESSVFGVIFSFDADTVATLDKPGLNSIQFCTVALKFLDDLFRRHLKASNERNNRLTT